jgi:lantibiotic biosynthesis protein
VTARRSPGSTQAAGCPAEPGGWAPVLHGAEAARTLAVVERIADDLISYEVAHPTALDDARTLASGRAGIALFHLYRYRATGHPRARVEATEMLDAAIEDAAAVPRGHGLAGGLAGIGFTIAHAAGSLGGDPDDLLTGVDATLLRVVEASPSQGPCDLLDGLVGLGVYGLERLPSPAGARLVTATIARLEELAEHWDDGITWSTPPAALPDPWRRISPFGRYDLGMARGVPGVVSFLARACQAGFDTPAQGLLEGAVKWLCGRALPGGRAEGASYPAWVVPGTAALGPARTAWCYGDPGIAASLAGAGFALQRDDWLQAAADLARATHRRSITETGVLDGGLCHGAGGLGVVFARLHQTSGDPKLLDTARFWFRRTLELDRHGTGFGGYSAWRYPHEATGCWEEDPGLLEGAAGVGLALLAAATPIAPAWDRLLLLS